MSRSDVSEREPRVPVLFARMSQTSWLLENSEGVITDCAFCVLRSVSQLSTICAVSFRFMTGCTLSAESSTFADEQASTDSQSFDFIIRGPRIQTATQMLFEVDYGQRASHTTIWLELDDQKRLLDLRSSAVSDGGFSVPQCPKSWCSSRFSCVTCYY